MTREIDYSSDLPSAPRAATVVTRAASTLGLMFGLFCDRGAQAARTTRPAGSAWFVDQGLAHDAASGTPVLCPARSYERPRRAHG